MESGVNSRVFGNLCYKCGRTRVNDQLHFRDYKTRALKIINKVIDVFQRGSPQASFCLVKSPSACIKSMQISLPCQHHNLVWQSLPHSGHELGPPKPTFYSQHLGIHNFPAWKYCVIQNIISCAETCGLIIPQTRYKLERPENLHPIHELGLS